MAGLQSLQRRHLRHISKARAGVGHRAEGILLPTLSRLSSSVQLLTYKHHISTCSKEMFSRPRGPALPFPAQPGLPWLCPQLPSTLINAGPCLLYLPLLHSWVTKAS